MKFMILIMYYMKLKFPVVLVILFQSLECSESDDESKPVGGCMVVRPGCVSIETDQTSVMSHLYTHYCLACRCLQLHRLFYNYQY